MGLSEQAIKDLDLMCKPKPQIKEDLTLYENIGNMNENELNLLKRKIDFFLEKKLGERKRLQEKHFNTQTLSTDEWINKL
jgi:hypothetical protein